MDTYKRALVTYIDILGFRTLIEESKQSQMKVLEILDLVQTVKDEFSTGRLRLPLREAKKSSAGFIANSFSDLIVRTTYVDDLDVTEHLNWEITYIGDRQLELLLKGTLLRGGICIDQVLADKEIIFGPALVKSYFLESRYAVFPRVAIDWKALYDDGGELRRFLQPNRLKRGEDGVYFVDYLFNSFFDRTDPWEVLEQHRSIFKTLTKDIHERDEGVRQKYMWLGLYHNDVIERLIEKEPKERDRFLKILLSDADLRF